MDPTTAAAVAAVSSTGTGGIATVILFVSLVLIPLVIKVLSWSKETSAQGILYKQLSDLVKSQREELDKVYAIKMTLQEQLLELRLKVEKMEGAESTIVLLKEKLDLKDQIIAERDKRIEHLMSELLSMKERVHHLELRLAQDERKFIESLGD